MIKVIVAVVVLLVAVFLIARTLGLVGGGSPQPTAGEDGQERMESVEFPSN